MATKEMTVHKALCELKTLGDRIDKKVRNTEFIVGNKHNNDKINDKTIVQWKKDTKAEYQSLMDLIKYRNALKQAVAMSNANTKVTVCGKEYTVAEAIELKNNWIPILKDLSYKLSQNNNQVTITVDRLNDEVERTADEQMEKLFTGKDKTAPTKEMLDFRTQYIEQRKYDIIDPIGVESEIRKLEDTILDYMVEVDSELSRSNAVTLITVEW